MKQLGLRARLALSLMTVTMPSSLTAQTVTGVTLYPPDQLVEWAQEHVAPETNPDAIAAAIELLYHSQGYLAAEAIPAIASDGRTIIVVHEGRVGAVHLEGGNAKAQGVVGRFIAPLADGTPLTIDRLERQLLLAGDQGGIDVTASLSHPDPAADSLLDVNISQLGAPGAISIDTIPQRPGTTTRVLLQQEGYSLLSGGDLVRALGVVTRADSGDIGVAGQLVYRVPIGGHGLFAEFYGGTALANRELDTLQIRNEQRGSQYGAAIGFPVIRTMGRSLFLVAEAEHIEGRSTIGGLRTRSRVDALRGHFLGTRSFADGTQIEGSFRASVGKSEEIDPVSPQIRRGEFASLRAEAGLVTPIAPSFFFQAEIEGQLALSDLPEVEHFFLGHLPLVRGYAQGAVEADSGAATSIQLDRVFQASETTNLTAFVFSDLGLVRQRGPDPDFVQDEEIASVGSGLTFAHSSGLSVTSWLALPLADSRLTEAGDPLAYIRLTQRW